VKVSKTAEAGRKVTTGGRVGKKKTTPQGGESWTVQGENSVAGGVSTSATSTPCQEHYQGRPGGARDVGFEGGSPTTGPVPTALQQRGLEKRDITHKEPQPPQKEPLYPPAGEKNVPPIPRPGSRQKKKSFPTHLRTS